MNPDPASCQAGGSNGTGTNPKVNPDPASSQAGGSDGSGADDPASSGPSDDLTRVRERAAALWRQRVAAAADPCGPAVESEESEEAEEPKTESEEEALICDLCFAQGGAVWQEDGTTKCADCKAKEEESEEDKTPSERTLRRNEIQNEIAGLYDNLENMQTLEPNVSIAFTIAHLEARIAELQGQVQGLDTTEMSEGEADEILWEESYDTWRRGKKMWLTTYNGGPSGGYVLDVEEDKVLKWDRRGFVSDTTFEAVPDNKTLWFLLRPNHTPPESVRLFDNDEDVLATYPDAERALEYYAFMMTQFTDEEPSERAETSEGAPAAPPGAAEALINGLEAYFARPDSSDSPGSPGNEMLHNISRERAQKRLNHLTKKKADLLRERDRLNAEAEAIDADNPRLLAAAADTPEHTEEKPKNDQCTFCLEDFKEDETVMMNRCGHGVCLPCANDAVDKGSIMKCTICLGSETLRAIKFKSVLEPEPDLSVFIKPSAAPDPVDVPIPSDSNKDGSTTQKTKWTDAERAIAWGDVPVPSTEEPKAVSSTRDPVDVPVPSTSQSEEEKPTMVSKSKGRKGNKKDNRLALRAPDRVDPMAAVPSGATASVPAPTPDPTPPPTPTPTPEPMPAPTLDPTPTPEPMPAQTLDPTPPPSPCRHRTWTPHRRRLRISAPWTTGRR